LTRDVIARGIFSSVADLKRKLMRYIRQYSLAPKPVKWVHRDPAHRITADSRVTVQTLIASVRYKYVSGRLQEKRSRPTTGSTATARKRAAR